MMMVMTTKMAMEPFIEFDPPTKRNRQVQWAAEAFTGATVGTKAIRECHCVAVRVCDACDVCDGVGHERAPAVNVPPAVLRCLGVC